MRRNTHSILIFLFLSITSFSQDMTCDDFKNGKFISATMTEPSLEIEVIRKGNEQVELVKNPNEIYPNELQSKQYGKIEWINDCTYRLTYDESKMDLSEFQIVANKNGGSLNEIYKIDQNCFYYKSTMKINEKLETISGKICKEKN